MYYTYTMKIAKEITIWNRLFFLFIKKALCVLLTVALLFNISFTKNHELKDRFLLAFSCAVNTIESAVFNEYTNALMKTINIAVRDLSVIIQKTLADKSSNKKKDSTPVSSNSSSDYVILTKRINDSYKAIGFVKTSLLYLTYDVIRQRNILYKDIIVNCKKVSDNIGILLFILFSIFIVRRKEVTDTKVIKNVKIIENRLA